MQNNFLVIVRLSVKCFTFLQCKYKKISNYAYCFLYLQIAFSLHSLEASSSYYLIMQKSAARSAWDSGRAVCPTASTLGESELLRFPKQRQNWSCRCSFPLSQPTYILEHFFQLLNPCPFAPMLEMHVPYTFSFLKKKKKAKQDNKLTQTYIFIASIFQPFCIGNSVSERAQTQFPHKKLSI